MKVVIIAVVGSVTVLSVNCGPTKEPEVAGSEGVIAVPELTFAAVVVISDDNSILFEVEDGLLNIRSLG